MLIKKRKAKVSERGLYLQDIELLETEFKPGTSYNYKIDPTSNTVMIYPSDKGNMVSKRKYKEDFKSVIDIRNREALQAFKGSEYLDVEIYESYIKVIGFKSAVANAQVYDIADYREIAQAVFSREQLSSVATGTNGYDHLFNESELTYGFGPINEVLTAISLFSGAGVMDIGFKDDFNIVFGLERDKNAALTYRHNHGDHMHETDITLFDKSTIPKADIIFGGPPCQGFSNANRISNFIDNPNNFLVKHFIEAVLANENCKVFVMENVPQILTAGDGRFLKEIEDRLSDFQIHSGVLNAADFGSPQRRRRAFIIGSKIGSIPLPESTTTHFMNIGQAFLGLDDNILNQKDITKSKPATVEKMTYVPPGGNIFDIPEAIRPKGTHSIAYRRLRLDEVSPTIVNPGKSMILHPSKDRILSVRECARLFDVPDSFEFKGPLRAMQQQIANAVPVKLARAVSNAVKHAFTTNLAF